MIMPDNKAFEESCIHETANHLAERNPDRIKQRIQDKYLAIAVGNDSSVKQWFVLRTAHRKENDVHKVVIDAGIEAWLPMKKAIQKRRFNKPSHEVIVPIFNGYLFVKVVSCAWVGLSAIAGAVPGYSASKMHWFLVRNI